jgi:hypothetical protein
MLKWLRVVGSPAPADRTACPFGGTMRFVLVDVVAEG